MSGHVYVLSRFLDDRPHIPVPTRSRAEMLMQAQFDADRLKGQPELRDFVAIKRMQDSDLHRGWRTWATDTLTRLALGQPLPAGRRTAAAILELLYQAGREGRTRPEVCEALSADGGKVSAVLTNLHGAGIVYPLTEKR